MASQRGVYEQLVQKAALPSVPPGFRGRARGRYLGCGVAAIAIARGDGRRRHCSAAAAAHGRVVGNAASSFTSCSASAGTGRDGSPTETLDGCGSLATRAVAAGVVAVACLAFPDVSWLHENLVTHSLCAPESGWNRLRRPSLWPPRAGGTRGHNVLACR
eukprot:TRINITY_DN15927_c1_g1_i2.p1 TRINITY_DN15927_c1_g1~~TRINITY_DN15927_c1_g1_i2.p1  ORF type:complete len:160 (+),score=14.37 TRINITY_DN15927_c1_g1_i2:99-578(+)